MFDKLIESDSRSAESKNRGGYFTVSTLVMGIVLFTGVLVSIYGADFDIETSNLEFAQLIAPVAPAEPQPDPPRQTPQQQHSAETSLERPMREAAIQRIDEFPTNILPVSSVPSKYKERPYGNFGVGKDFDPPGGISGLPTGEGNDPSVTGLEPGNGLTKVPETIPPPPVLKKVEPKKEVIVSLGVVNGKAKSLPPPPYPPAAKIAGIAGSVSVQITIDFDGSVISSRAVSGHPLLKRAAEDAARRAKFSPTYLSNVPVKATGFIAYNFKKS